MADLAPLRRRARSRGYALSALIQRYFRESTSFMLISDEALEVTQVTLVEMQGLSSSFEQEQFIEAIVLPRYKKNEMSPPVKALIIRCKFVIGLTAFLRPNQALTTLNPNSPKPHNVLNPPKPCLVVVPWTLEPHLAPCSLIKPWPGALPSCAACTERNLRPVGNVSPSDILDRRVCRRRSTTLQSAIGSRVLDRRCVSLVLTLKSLIENLLRLLDQVLPNCHRRVLPYHEAKLAWQSASVATGASGTKPTASSRTLSDL